MSDLFDFNVRKDQYAVMGNPIGHSKSPRIHTLFAQQTGQNLEYTAIQVDPGGLEQAVGNFDASGGKGLNITVPFKEEATKLVDEMSERARRAGAVNTIKFDNQRRFGDNTDGIGLIRDLADNNGYTIKGERILLMGAGGAARGVIGPLLEHQPQILYIGNRTPDKAASLAQLFKDMGNVHGCGYSDLDGKQLDLIVNATSASLAGEVPALGEVSMAMNGVCYDMMYGREPTPFMRWARDRGVVYVLDGLGMLVEQAAAAFEIWRGVRPDTAPVIETLRKEMGDT